MQILSNKIDVLNIDVKKICANVDIIRYKLSTSINMIITKPLPVQPTQPWNYNPCIFSGEPIDPFRPKFRK